MDALSVASVAAQARSHLISTGLALMWSRSFHFRRDWDWAQLSEYFFFFSSRRRHTRSLCDWSSDVCSSDLDLPRGDAVSDGFGYASGALRYDLDLLPGSARDVYLATPFGAADPALAPSFRDFDGAEQFDAAVRDWSGKLGRVAVRLPPTARAFSDTFRTAAAHILINRDGPALQPGPRRYARSWIRDGATMAAALLRVGCTGEVRDYIRWYARHQAPDGTVPCCVDRNGPDWLAEYDSQGELIYAVMEAFRFTRDRAFLVDLWPAVMRSVDRIEALCSQRLTAEFQTPET